MNKSHRIFYLDFIRVIAILLVVFIHVSAIDTTLNVGSGQWQITKILNYFAHISVPVFFMISGSLLLNSKKTISLSYTWKKESHTWLFHLSCGQLYHLLLLEFMHIHYLLKT